MTARGGPVPDPWRAYRHMRRRMLWVGSGAMLVLALSFLPARKLHSAKPVLAAFFLSTGATLWSALAVASFPCPRCGKPLTDAAGLGWCRACGYCRSLEEAKAPAPETSSFRRDGMSGAVVPMRWPFDGGESQRGS